MDRGFMEFLASMARGSRPEPKRIAQGVVPAELMVKLESLKDRQHALRLEFAEAQEELARKFQERVDLEVEADFNAAWGAIHDHFNHTPEQRAEGVKYTVGKKDNMLYLIEGEDEDVNVEVVEVEVTTGVDLGQPVGD